MEWEGGEGRGAWEPGLGPGAPRGRWAGRYHVSPRDLSSSAWFFSLARSHYGLYLQLPQISRRAASLPRAGPRLPRRRAGATSPASWPGRGGCPSPWSRCPCPRLPRPGDTGEQNVGRIEPGSQEIAPDSAELLGEGQFPWPPVPRAPRRGREDGAGDSEQAGQGGGGEGPAHLCWIWWGGRSRGAPGGSVAREAGGWGRTPGPAGTRPAPERPAACPQLPHARRPADGAHPVQLDTLRQTLSLPR